MEEVELTAAKKKGRINLPGIYSNWLVDFCFAIYLRVAGNLRGVTRIIKYVFQISGLVIALWSGLFLSGAIGAFGIETYLQTLGAGLSFQGNSPLFYNGVVAVVMTLVFLYGILSACSFNKSLYVADLALLYLLIFQSFAIHQLPVLVNTGIIIAIWIVHRLVLGSIAVFYKKNVQIQSSISGKEN